MNFRVRGDDFFFGSALVFHQGKAARSNNKKRSLKLGEGISADQAAVWRGERGWMDE